MGTGIYNEYVNLGIEWPPGMCLFLIFSVFFQVAFSNQNCFTFQIMFFQKLIISRILA